MLHLMNSLMMPTDNLVYHPVKITEQEAKRIFQLHKKNVLPCYSCFFKCYIGYPNACAVATEILDHSFVLSRELTNVKANDTILVLKLRYRVNPNEKKGRKHGNHPEDYDWFVCSVFSPEIIQS